ncbi:MAG: NHLP-related RiPP peptide [Tahibacter sp.]
MTDILTAKQVDQLLDALSSDDRFRDLFSRDPAAAMEELGLPAAFATCCAKTKTLASKEAIRSSRAVLEAQLLGTLAHNPHSLDAG